MRDRKPTQIHERTHMDERVFVVFDYFNYYTGLCSTMNKDQISEEKNLAMKMILALINFSYHFERTTTSGKLIELKCFSFGEICVKLM